MLMRECEYHMEVGSINDLGPALVHPDFLIDSLAVRAAAVPAGIVMELQVSAIRTTGNVAAKGTAFTGHEGAGGFELYIRRLGRGRIIIPAEVKNLLYFTGHNDLPYGRRD